MLSLTVMAVTRAEADAYAALRGLSDWTGTDTAKDQALRRGQDYIIGRYNDRWTYMEPSTDGYAWVYRLWTNDDPPDAVKYAIFEAGIREILVPFSLSPDFVLGDKKVLTEVKGIKWTPMGSGGAASYRPTITSISMVLTGHATLGGNIPVARA